MDELCCEKTDELEVQVAKESQRYPSKAENWINYRKQRNYVTTLCRKTEAQYWKAKFEKNGQLSKRLENGKRFNWKTVKAMNGVQKQKQIGPIKGDNNQILTADIDMANCLNLYFSTTGEKLADANSQMLQTENLNLRTENVWP